MRAYKCLPVLLVLMSLGFSQLAYSQVLALKLGIQHWDYWTNPAFLAVESRLGERLSFQPELGLGSRAQKSDPPARRDNLQVGVQGRGYLLLRQGQYLCGLYVGPYVMHYREQWRYDDPDVALSRNYYSSGGLALGFQQALWSRIRVDEGLRLGYHGKILSQVVSTTGDILYASERGGGFVGAIHIQLGYAF